MSKEPEAAAVSAAGQDEIPPQLTVLQRSLIVRSRTNPRTHFDPVYIKEMGASLKAHGFLQPILVRPLPAARLQETFEDREPGQPLPTHEIVCGECRWRGAGEEAIDDIPVMIRHLDDHQVLQVQLVENLKRLDLHPLEEAEGYDRLMKDHHMTVDAIADSVKKSTSYVYKSLKLLDLTPECRAELYAGKLSQSTALLVARAPAHLQAQIAKDVMKTDWQGEPMSFRAAVKHIQNNYMLQLSAAVFNIQDAKLLPKAGSCQACPKRTGANTELFDDIEAADTCTDPKCFGDKKEAHFAGIAAAAAAKGQTVIMGKEAKELMPNSYNDPKGYTLLDKKEYVDGRHVSVRGLIGKENLPTPVIFINPHTKEVQEALPDSVASKLIAKGKRARTVAKTAAAESKEPDKRDLEQQFAEQWQATTLRALHDKVMADGAANVGNKARVTLLREIGAQLADNLWGKRAEQLADLLKLGKVGLRHGFSDYFEKCREEAIAPALMLLLVASDMSEHEGKDLAPIVKLVAGEVGVDVKAIQADVQTEMKAAAAARAEKAKPAAKAAPAAKKPKTGQAEARAGIADAMQKAEKPAKPPKAATPKGTAGKKGTPTFMQPLTLSPELEALVGPGPLVRTEVVSKLWAYVKKHKLQDTVNKRMLNTDDKLKAIFGDRAQFSMFELATALGKHISTAGAAEAAVPKASAGAGSTSPPPVDVDAQPPRIGVRVRIKDGLKGPNGINRKICGREGKLVTTTPGGGWSFRADDAKGVVLVKREDFVVIEPMFKANIGAPTPAALAAWPFPTKASPKGQP